MEAHTRLRFAVLGALVALACSNADAPSDGPSTMQAALSDAQLETGQHANACREADSQAAMLVELDRHDSRMTALTNRMDAVVPHMGRCSGGDRGGFSRSFTDMQSAMLGHDQRMRSAETLESARSECSAHVNAMSAMIADMMGDLTGMTCMMGME